MVNSIALLAPNVARAERSNSTSAVSTTTWVRFTSALGPRPRRMTSIEPALLHRPGRLGNRRPDWRRIVLAVRALLIVVRRADALWLDHAVGAIAFDRGFHLGAAEGDVFVGAGARPGIDHLADLVGRDGIAAAQRDRVAAIEIFRTAGERGEQRGKRKRAQQVIGRPHCRL